MTTPSSKAPLRTTPAGTDAFDNATRRTFPSYENGRSLGCSTGSENMSYWTTLSTVIPTRLTTRVSASARRTKDTDASTSMALPVSGSSSVTTYLVASNACCPAADRASISMTRILPAVRIHPVQRTLPLRHLVPTRDRLLGRLLYLRCYSGFHLAEPLGLHVLFL